MPLRSVQADFYSVNERTMNPLLRKHRDEVISKLPLTTSWGEPVFYAIEDEFVDADWPNPMRREVLIVTVANQQHRFYSSKEARDFVTR